MTRSRGIRAYDVETKMARYIEPTGSCWNWIGGRDGRGYGRVCIDKTQQRAHRWVYETLVGPIEPGLQLDHLCRNILCVNPDHLESVTPVVNVHRGRKVALLVPIRACRKAGHPYNEENTRVNAQGYRVCRACDLARRS